MNWSSLGTTLSNLQQTTSEPGAKNPATAVYTEKCILEAASNLWPGLTRDLVTNQAGGGKAQNSIPTFS